MIAAIKGFWHKQRRNIKIGAVIAALAGVGKLGGDLYLFLEERWKDRIEQAQSFNADKIDEESREAIEFVRRFWCAPGHRVFFEKHPSYDEALTQYMYKNMQTEEYISSFE